MRSIWINSKYVSEWTNTTSAFSYAFIAFTWVPGWARRPFRFCFMRGITSPRASNFTCAFRVLSNCGSVRRFCLGNKTEGTVPCPGRRYIRYFAVHDPPARLLAVRQWRVLDDQQLQIPFCRRCTRNVCRAFCNAFTTKYGDTACMSIHGGHF